MAIIVQKFGGTSLRDANGLKFLLSHVKKCKDNGNDIVIVVSSMGRKGEPYATDTFIGELEKIDNNIDPVKKDLIMSCGEVISCAVVSHLLDSQGMPAIALTGFQAGILTDDNFNSAEIINIDTSAILENLNIGKIVVVAGFQGITSDMKITTLGRGGSDITAVTLGGYLDAERVDIFTDVEGVAVVDPRIIPFAEYLEAISYSNMYNLASNGANVIHPKAVLAAEKYNIPVHVCSTFGEKKGTIISKYEKINEENIIGISLDKDTCPEEDLSKMSIFFTKSNNLKIKKNINSFLSQNRSQLSEVLWQEDMVQFTIDTNKTISFTEKLYSYFFKR